jgi:hypothetical protein
MQEFNYSLHELENMMPWERDVYVGMLVRHLERKAQKKDNQF